MENLQSIEYIKQAFELRESKNYKPAIEMLYKALEIENDNVEILSHEAFAFFFHARRPLLRERRRVSDRTFL